MPIRTLDPCDYLKRHDYAPPLEVTRNLLFTCQFTLRCDNTMERYVGRGSILKICLSMQMTLMLSFLPATPRLALQN